MDVVRVMRVNQGGSTRSLCDDSDKWRDLISGDKRGVGVSRRREYRWSASVGSAILSGPKALVLVPRCLVC